MDINEATAKALSAERAAAGLTIKELSNASGVPERTLIRMLKNERDIKITQVAQISAALGIYPHEIIETAEHFIERADKRKNTLHTASDKESASAVSVSASAGGGKSVVSDEDVADHEDISAMSDEERIEVAKREYAEKPWELAALHDPNKKIEMLGDAGPDWDDPA